MGALNNPDFNPIEFDGFRKHSGLNSFTLTPKQWIEKTSAIGLISKPGRYGGTYAHKDIAYEFASWISVEFKLYLIKEFQRLKDEFRKFPVFFPEFVLWTFTKQIGFPVEKLYSLLPGKCDYHE